jgi:hypothetical protein
LWLKPERAVSGGDNHDHCRRCVGEGGTHQGVELCDLRQLGQSSTRHCFGSRRPPHAVSAAKPGRAAAARREPGHRDAESTGDVRVPRSQQHVRLDAAGADRRGVIVCWDTRSCLINLTLVLRRERAWRESV